MEEEGREEEVRETFFSGARVSYPQQFRQT
jgi:hypothetical protein